MKIDSRLIGKDCQAYIIAEIGINHNGDLNVAKKLIDAAVDAGADAVKFQKRTPEIVTPKNIQKRIRYNTPWGNIPYIEYRRNVEFDKQDYYRIDKHCTEVGITWFASPWDIPSVEFLEKFDVPAYKVASAMLTNLPLIEAIGKTAKPIILSKGGSTITEVHIALEKILSFTDFAIMHCVAKYPCPDKNLHLKDIPHLKLFFDIVGYSGHEIGIATSVAAVVMGADIVERHITLDRAMWGSDQAASLEPQGFKRLVRDIRTVESAMNGGQGKPQDIEIEVIRRLRYHE